VEEIREQNGKPTLSYLIKGGKVTGKEKGWDKGGIKTM